MSENGIWRSPLRQQLRRYPSRYAGPSEQPQSRKQSRLQSLRYAWYIDWPEEMGLRRAEECPTGVPSKEMVRQLLLRRGNQPLQVAFRFVPSDIILHPSCESLSQADVRFDCSCLPAVTIRTLLRNRSSVHRVPVDIWPVGDRSC